MTPQEDHHQEAHFMEVEDIQKVGIQEEEDFPMEEDHQEEPWEEETIMAEIEDQTSWWETLQKYSREYEQKLSLSLLFGGSMQALTVKTLPSPTRTKEEIGRAHV